nr:hypothetical protein CFP56_19358 [Quercus suber]
MISRCLCRCLALLPSSHQSRTPSTQKADTSTPWSRIAPKQASSDTVLAMPDNHRQRALHMPPRARKEDDFKSWKWGAGGSVYVLCRAKDDNYRLRGECQRLEWQRVLLRDERCWDSDSRRVVTEAMTTTTTRVANAGDKAPEGERRGADAVREDREKEAYPFCEGRRESAKSSDKCCSSQLGSRRGSGIG